LKGSREYSY